MAVRGELGFGGKLLDARKMRKLISVSLIVYF